MIQSKKRVQASGMIILLLVLTNVIAIREGYTDNEKCYWALVLTLPLLLIAILNISRKRHDKKQNVALDMQADPKASDSEWVAHSGKGSIC